MIRRMRGQFGRTSISVHAGALFVVLASCTQSLTPSELAAQAGSVSTPAFVRAPAAATTEPPAQAAATSQTAELPQPKAALPAVAVAPPGMAWVPDGTFTMGSDVDGQPDERPAHEVTIAGFYLDITEVTQFAYAECVTAGQCRPIEPKLLARQGGRFTGPSKPVVNVTWGDADHYCAYRHKRLPSEAEFERAARGDDQRRFPWGNQFPTAEHAIFAARNTAEVGSKPLGRGPFGHDDLAGNVWEWTRSDYDPLAYTRSGASRGEPADCTQILITQAELRADGRRGFTGSNPIPRECEKVLRGGAYNYEANGLRSSNRVHHPPNFRLLVAGLRCAQSAAP